MGLIQARCRLCSNTFMWFTGADSQLCGECWRRVNAQAQQHVQVRIPAQYIKRQRGGSFTVNGYLALLLLAVAIGAAAWGYYQHAHRVINMTIEMPSTVIHGSESDDTSADYGVVHAFPETRDVCTSFDTICSVRI